MMQNERLGHGHFHLAQGAAACIISAHNKWEVICVFLAPDC